MRVVCYNCNKMFGDYDYVKGVVKCPRCKKENKIDIVSQKDFFQNKQIVNEEVKIK